jgi:hypothetical protein
MCVLYSKPCKGRVNSLRSPTDTLNSWLVLVNTTSVVSNSNNGTEKSCFKKDKISINRTVSIILLKCSYWCRNWTSTGCSFLELKVEEERYMTGSFIMSAINRIHLVRSSQGDWDYSVRVGKGSREKIRELSNRQSRSSKHRWEQNRKTGSGGTTVKVDSLLIAKFRTEWRAGNVLGLYGKRRMIEKLSVYHLNKKKRPKE